MKEVGTVATAVEPDQIITSKRLKSIEIVVDNEEQMSLEIAGRLLKLNVDAHEMEIIRANILAKDVAYTGLNADHRRIIDYMCRSLHFDEVVRDGGLWHTSYDFFRKLFPDPKTHEEIRNILDSLADKRFKIRNIKTGTVDNFQWLNRVIYKEERGAGTITIEITSRVSEYHRIPRRAEMIAYGGYSQYYLTASVGLLLSHQLFFHFVLGKRVEWASKNKNVNPALVALEITINELRNIWALSEKTKPYDLERYWLRDACARMSVATQIKVTKIEPLRSATRGKRIYAYRLYISEVAKDEFVGRFSRALDSARGDLHTPQQAELTFPDAEDRAPRLDAIKAALRQLGAYNGQLHELDSFADTELLWLDDQMAIWEGARSAIYQAYKRQGEKERTEIGLLWRCIKNRVDLKTEYPQAFIAIERQKKAAIGLEKAQEHSLGGCDLLEDQKERAQKLAAWFSDLNQVCQTSFVELVIENKPQSAALMTSRGFRDVIDKVLRQGKNSPFVPYFAEQAAYYGYQAQ
jgi:hypothetical protein